MGHIYYTKQIQDTLNQVVVSTLNQLQNGGDFEEAKIRIGVVKEVAAGLGLDYSSLPSSRQLIKVAYAGHLLDVVMR